MKTGRFKQIKTKQSNRILDRSPQTQMLLYDYTPVAVLDFHPESLPWGWFPFGLERDSTSVVSYGPVLPFALAIAIGKFDSSLYRFCHSFAQQFTRRYFNLLDLDFRANSISAVKGFPGRFDSPNIVINLRIGPSADNLPETAAINREAIV